MPLHLQIARCLIAVLALATATAGRTAPRPLQLTRADYQDRVEAIWKGQILGVLLGFAFEHKVASAGWVDDFYRANTHDRQTYQVIPVDDDWYHEISALRAFEKYGIGLTAAQLGQQWLADGCGAWGSSEQARFNLEKGLPAPDCGHPRYNKLLVRRTLVGTAGSDRNWEDVAADLKEYVGQTVQLRLYQGVLVSPREAGNAYWKNLTVR